MEKTAMKRLVTHISPSARMAIVLSACSVIIALMVGMGCTDRLKGEVDANQKPYVNFVNVPPDLQSFSRNPVVNWYGSDVDGIIASFRYVVVLKADVGLPDPISSADLIAYVLDTSNVPESLWTVLIVDPKGPDPKTSQIVRMTADFSDPIRQYVEQYVFLQAFDAEGAASDVVYRLFSRNDHPPQTRILGYAESDTPFVNSVFPGGAVSGVPLRWLGSDLIDYPQDPPPFLFHWRLYGPYDSTKFADIRRRYFKRVLLTRDAQVIDSGVLLTKCDTTIVGPDTTVACDTVTVRPSNAARIAAIFGADYGVFEPQFDVDDSSFVADNAKGGANRIVAESRGIDTFWTSKLDTILFNIFKDDSQDTTQQLYFIPWVRARDDAAVPDPVPAYLPNGISVIDPKFERSVLVVDFTNGAMGGVLPLKADTFWSNYINKWEITTGKGAQYSNAVDNVSYAARGLLKRLLQHRIVILYNDNSFKAEFWSRANYYGPVLKAVAGGVNCWMNMRCPVTGGLQVRPEFTPVPAFNPLYTVFFGVLTPAPLEHYYYSGWAYYAWGDNTQANLRTETFKGARPLANMESMWPTLLIDTSLLHQNYNWSFLQQIDGNTGDTIRAPFRWISEKASLPEVNWTPRLTPGTDPMYFYYSMYSDTVLGDASNGRIYGGSDPRGQLFDHSFRPIAHQFDNGFFRTVHMDFTLPAIKRDDKLDSAFFRIMNYLWNEDLNAVVSEKRYPDAKAAWTEERFRNTWNQVRETWNIESGWTPEDALK
jgi:hypothetical protein